MEITGFDKGSMRFACWLTIGLDVRAFLGATLHLTRIQMSGRLPYETEFD